MIAVGLLEFHASVHRFSVRFAPFSIPSNHAPPSSEYFEASSATPQPIGGSFDGLFGEAHAAPAATSATRHATARRALTATSFDPEPCVPTPLPRARLQLRALLALLALRRLHGLGLRPAAREAGEVQEGPEELEAEALHAV